jgi:hypothetical protein
MGTECQNTFGLLVPKINRKTNSIWPNIQEPVTVLFLAALSFSNVHCSPLFYFVSTEGDLRETNCKDGK